MTIANTTEIQAELQIDEGDIAKVDIGHQVEVYPAAYPDRPLRGVVEQIALAPTISGQSRAYQVTVDIEVPEGVELRSGMSARADIFLSDGTQKLAVPVESVITDTHEDDEVTRHVWVDRDGKAEKVEVETGVSDDRWEEITDGLDVGDRVIVGPARTLRTLQEGAEVTQAQEDEDEGGEDDADAEDEDEVSFS